MLSCDKSFSSVGHTTNMRFLLVALLAGLCAAVSVPNGKHTFFGTIKSNFYTGTGYQASRQKEIYRLFKYVNQLSYYPDHIEIGKSYRFYENKPEYTVSFNLHTKCTLIN